MRVRSEREAAAKPIRHTRAALLRKRRGVHVVERGSDTLWKIARRYTARLRRGALRSRWLAVLSVRISIYPGQVLRVPRSQSEPPRSAEQSALSSVAPAPYPRGRGPRMWGRVRPAGLFRALNPVPSRASHFRRLAASDASFACAIHPKPNKGSANPAKPHDFQLRAKPKRRLERAWSVGKCGSLDGFSKKGLPMVWPRSDGSEV